MSKRVRPDNDFQMELKLEGSFVALPNDVPPSKERKGSAVVYKWPSVRKELKSHDQIVERLIAHAKKLYW